MTRRRLLATLIGVPIMGNGVATQGKGFVVTGKADATEGEKLEGYVNLGKEFCLVAHPRSPAYPKLMELVGHDVTVTVEPT